MFKLSGLRTPSLKRSLKKLYQQKWAVYFSSSLRRLSDVPTKESEDAFQRTVKQSALLRRTVGQVVSQYSL